MGISSLIWDNLRKLNHLPGAYRLYSGMMNLLYPDGKTVVIRQGPAAGYRWKRYRAHQAWMAMGVYEPQVASLIFETLHPGDLFFDVGSNAGYYALVAARAVGPRGSVIAFEPVPFNVKTIQENIDLNQLAGVCKVEACALSDQAGVLSFVVPARNANAHLQDIDAPNVHDRRGEVIQVPTRTLDDYIQQSGQMPALLKMDIEGAELAALRGASAMLNAANNPILLISTHSPALDAGVKQLLDACGYQMKNLAHFEQMIYALPSRLQVA